jgi:hypothetical protein
MFAHGNKTNSGPTNSNVSYSDDITTTPTSIHSKDSQLEMMYYSGVVEEKLVSSLNVYESQSYCSTTAKA